MSPEGIGDFLAFLNASPSPWHAADKLACELAASGFQAVGYADVTWPVKPGGRYFLRRGAAVVAWIVPTKTPNRLVLGLAHTDSPGLRLKPNTESVACGCRKLAVDVYGGLLNHTWLDRELEIAGRVCHQDGGWIREDLVRLHDLRPIVPSLAIHLDRGVNERGLTVDRERHFPVLLGLESADSLKASLANALGTSSEAILAWDLCLCDASAAALAGSSDLVVSGRLDNLASCHAMARALALVPARSDTLVAVAFLDGEEVGSTASEGADSVFLPQILERLSLSLGMDRAQFLAWAAGGLALSADMAHAVHPNHPERHAQGHAPVLGGGPVLKWNAGLRYATTAHGAGLLRQIACDAGVALQNFAMRADLACGSTVGPLVASQLGLEVVDCGAPMLAMHSARETMAACDQLDSIRLYQAFLTAA